ncbi:MAG: ABC transporter ATP-binding protein [Acidobacteria bacterium]|nr:ABC transporter ATP-binding protein [Acidobacteriota bacterium]
MRRLLTYLYPYRGGASLAAAAIVLHSLLELAPPYLTKVVIDTYIPSGDLSGLGYVALLLLATLTGSFALQYLQTFTLQMIGQRIMFDMRMQLHRHLHRLDLRFYDRNPVGRLMTRVTTDVDVLNELFTSGVVSVVGDLFTLVGIMGVLIWLDWRLALVAFAVLPLIALITQWFRANVRESYRTVRVWIARINAFLQERITGMTTVHLFRREARDFADFDEIDRKHRDASVQSIFYYAVFFPAIELVGALAAAMILWVGGGWVIDGTVTIGSLVAFLLYAQRFFRPISDMSEKFNVLQGAMASSERIFTLLDTPVGMQDGDAATQRASLPAQPVAGATPAVASLAASPTASVTSGAIAFEDVTFAYVEGEPVLKDVSFRVEPGQRVAIVGATGAGKSTVASLLLRFYDVQKGRITIDGVDIRRMELAGLRARFGLVLQDVHLFSGTIASNIRLGHETIDDEAVRRAVSAVSADVFIDRLPKGLDTPVAERGATLSVGQKQLLSFARALAFDPPVLILDEATSSIDTETELLIRDALQVVMRGRTTIAIAHRLSTIQGMDRILVLHKGQLRESGTHQELLAVRGIYHRLYRLQFASTASGPGPGSAPAVSPA